MEFSIATLLSHLSDNKLVAPKVLEKKLGCHDAESIEKLQIALDALERIGIIAKERGKYRRIAHEDIVEAKLRCSSKGFCFAIQDVEDAEDIYVRESHLGSAWNGDRVLVQVIKEASRRRSPEGEVKVILERSNPSLLARVKRTPEGYRAVPLDDRLLFELDLRNEDENILESAVDQLVHVEVLRYPLGNNPPFGRITRILGSNAEAAADTDIVCCKHDLAREFSREAIAAAQALVPKIGKAEFKQRRDLRQLLTLTLESEAAEGDLSTPSLVENAFTLEKAPNGNWRFGIHVTDIAHYIEVDSVLDLEARKRATAVFLGDLTLPLFPPAVLETCSLLPGQDRRAISIFLTLDSLGKVVEFEIQPTMICVDRQLSYQQAQSLLGRSEMVEPELAPTVDMLNELFFTLSPLVKAQRLQRGGFEIELTEAQSPFKDEGRLGTIVNSPALPIRSLLTELVILAGRVIAAHLQALDVPGLYCTQVPPDPTELEDLLKLGSNLGLELELESEEQVRPQDFQNFSQQFVKSSAPRVLAYMLKSTLKSTKYSTRPGAHFGLAYQQGGYSPCVSPGQRYADLCVQRALKAVFEQGRDRRHSRTKEGVNLASSSCHGKINWNVLPTPINSQLENLIYSTIHHLNEQQKLAEDAEADLAGLKKAEQMKERTGQVFQGLITGVQSYGFFVEIEDLLVEGLVHVSSLKDDWYEYRARHSCLVGRKNRTVYRLGSRVKVQVKSVDYYRQQIDLVTVNNATQGSEETFEES